MYSFFCEKLEKIDDVIELEKNEFHHLFKTLRAKTNEKVVLLDGNGKIATAIILENRTLKIIELREYPRQDREIALFVAAPRKQKLDQILKQATELGVDYITIMMCDYQVATPEGNNSRWDMILKESCKQSKNPYLPKLLPVMKFNEAIEYCKNEEFLCTFGDIEQGDFDKLNSSFDNVKKIAYFVGPEGGFSKKEFATFKEENFVGINLGPYILRLETAAICGIPLLRLLGKNGG